MKQATSHQSWQRLIRRLQAKYAPTKRARKRAMRPWTGVEAMEPRVLLSSTLPGGEMDQPSAPMSVLMTVDPTEPDQYEPNDTQQTAYDLGQLTTSTLTDLTIHQPDNVDYFQFTVQEISQVTIDAIFSHDLGDLDIALNRDTGLLIGESLSETDNESITAVLDPGVTYILTVTGYDAVNTYGLNFVVEPFSDYDDYELNNDFDQATDLGTIRTFSLTGLSLHSATDSDFFKFTADEDFRLSIEADYDRGYGDDHIDLMLYDADRAPLQSFFPITVQAGQTYYLEVNADGIHDHYDLHFEVLAAPKPDAYEQNDDVATASDLGVLTDSTISDLTIHSDEDIDYYRFTAAADSLLRIDAIFSHRFGDVDMKLYDAEESVIAQANSTTDNERLYAGIEAGKTYVLFVYGEPNQYDLDFTLTAPPEPDAYSPNQSLETAADLGIITTQTLHDLTIDHPGQSDYYQFTAESDGILTLEMTYDRAIGRLALDLTGQQGDWVDHSHWDFENRQQIRLLIEAGRTYVLTVSDDSNVVHTYDLEFAVEAMPSPDIYEPNNEDEPADLGLITHFTATGLTIHEPESSDYYTFTAETDGLLTAKIQFDHTRDDLDLYLWDDDVIYESSDSRADYERVGTPVQAGQTLYLSVSGSDEGVNEYDLHIDIVPFPQPDEHEPNNDFESATDLGSLSHYSATGLSILGEADVDVYQFTAETDGLFIANLGFIHGHADLYMKLYQLDLYGFPIAQSVSYTSDELLTAPVRAGETYHLMVATIDDDGATYYDIDLDIFTGPIPGDSIYRALDIGEVGSYEAYNVPFDSHWLGYSQWYTFTAATDGPLNVTLDFNHSFSDLGLELYLPINDDQPIAESHLRGDHEQILLDVVAGQQYYLKITEWASGPSSVYDLSIQLGDGTTTPGDDDDGDTGTTPGDDDDDGDTGTTPGDDDGDDNGTTPGDDDDDGDTGTTPGDDDDGGDTGTTPGDDDDDGDTGTTPGDDNDIPLSSGDELDIRLSLTDIRFPSAVVAGESATGRVLFDIINNTDTQFERTRMDARVYARPAGATDASQDTLVGQNLNFNVPALQPGASRSIRINVQLPADIAQGDYRFVVVATQAETPDSDQEAWSAADQTFTVAAAFHDIETAVDESRVRLPDSAVSGDNSRFRIPVTVTNRGNTNLPDRPMTVRVYAVSTDDPNVRELVHTQDNVNLRNLRPDRSKRVNLNFQLPPGLADGEYTFQVVVDEENVLEDPDTSNNSVTLSNDLAVDVAEGFIDLTVNLDDARRLDPAVVAGDGSSGRVRVSVTNQGNVSLPRGQQVDVLVYLRPIGATDDSQDILVGSQSTNASNLRPDRNRRVNVNVEIPADVAEDEYQLIVAVQPSDDLAERDTANNTQTTDVNLVVAEPFIDLVVGIREDRVRIPDAVVSGDGTRFRMPITVQNAGNITLASQDVAFEIYALPVVDGQVVTDAQGVLVETVETTLRNLRPGRDKRQNLQFTLPPGLADGDYTFQVQVVTNNDDITANAATLAPSLAVNVAEGFVDLTVALLTESGMDVLEEGETARGRVAVGIGNAGNVNMPRQQDVDVRIYLRPVETTGEPEDILIGNTTARVNNLRPDAQRRINVPVELTGDESAGAYRLVIVAEPQPELIEAETANNTLISEDAVLRIVSQTPQPPLTSVPTQPSDLTDTGTGDLAAYLGILSFSQESISDHRRYVAPDYRLLEGNVVGRGLTTSTTDNFAEQAAYDSSMYDDGRAITTPRELVMVLAVESKQGWITMALTFDQAADLPSLTQGLDGRSLRFTETATANTVGTVEVASAADLSRPANNMALAGIQGYFEWA